MKVGFNVTPLQSGHNTRGIGSYTRNLLAELKKLDAEIIEFTEDTPKVDVIFYPWFDLFFRTLKVGDTPTVITVHDTMPLIFPRGYPPGIKGRINLYFQKKELKSAKYIVTNSETSKKDINKFLKISDEKIEVIPLAPGPEFKVLNYPQKKRFKDKLKLPEKFLLYVGDANYVKNIPFLIKGFKALKEKSKFSSLRLVLIGTAFTKEINSNHPELKSLVETKKLIKKYKFENEVITPGQVTKDELIAAYNLATVYVQPSLYEGFGLPVLEAFASGCPVLSSDRASLPEVAGDGALYFNPEKINDFVEKASDILASDQMKRSLSKRGLVRVREFSWQKTAKETLDVFKKVAEGK